MGCASSRPASDRPPPGDAHDAERAKALAPPPLPTGHKLLAGFAKALDLEFGPFNEKEAVSTWQILELEARPSSSFAELGTDLQTCLDFVAVVEKAVREKIVTIDSLREHWGCPGEAKPPPPSGPVTLADVSVDAEGGSWQLRADAALAPKKRVDLDTDELDNDLDDSIDGDDGEHAGDDMDNLVDGDSRYR